MTEAGYAGYISRASYDNWTDYVPAYHSYYKSFKKMQMEKKKTKRQRQAVVITAVFAAIVMFLSGGVSFGRSESKDAYCVTKGDTLWSVAREYKPNGMTTGEYVYKIRRANNMNTSEIKVGDVLIIPE